MTCVLCVDFQIVVLFRSFFVFFCTVGVFLLPKLTPLGMGYHNCVVTTNDREDY